MKVLALLTALAALAVLPLLPRLHAQELPEGKGKDLVQMQCSSCHGLESVVAMRATREGWESVVGYMMSRGMIATDDEYETIVSYLAKAFPSTPAPEKPKQ
jgi:cytochrome c5